MKMNLRKRTGLAFTLIELLIVVAIIAILAAIAVPNFMEAQVRAKVSRAKADLRTLAVGLESYTVDNQRGPIGGNEGKGAPLNLWDEDHRHFAFNAITTPVAYLSTIPLDPFAINARIYNENQSNYKILPHYTYQHMKYKSGTNSAFGKAYGLGYQWYLRSVGPDKRVGKPYFSEMAISISDATIQNNTDNVYDSTNGTSSYGDVYTTNKGFFTGS